MTLLRKYFAVVGMLLLCIIPLVLWLGSADLHAITGSIGAFIQALGKTAAISGTTLYLMLPIVGMRHYAVEYAFGGLDRARRVHKLAGKIAFFTILAHPFLLGLGRLLSGRRLTTVWNWASLSVIVGITALFAMVAAVSLNMYGHIKHQRWVKVHYILSWIIPIFLLHGLLANSQIVHIKPLLWYIVGLSTTSFLLFYYQTLLRPYVKKRYLYQIADTHLLEGGVTELVLKTTGPRMPYRPGQYAFVSFISQFIDPEAHPFSFTTANNGPYLRFAIKALGDDTSNVAELKPGTAVYLDGPYGRFSYGLTKNKQQIWVAGGVGITPFLSMARSLSRHSDIKVTLFYATQRLQDAAFLHELFEIKRSLAGNFEVVLVDEKISGRISLDMMSKVIKDLQQPAYFMCGPQGMMKALKLQLVKAGVKQRSIHVEDFSN
jgi:predicted ferric reductase